MEKDKKCSFTLEVQQGTFLSLDIIHTLIASIRVNLSQMLKDGRFDETASLRSH